MDIASLCAQVQASREHRDFITHCNEEYQEEKGVQQTPKEEQEEEELIRGLQPCWIDAFCGQQPREAFQPIPRDDCIVMEIQLVLFQCVRECLSRDEAFTLFKALWMRNDLHRYKRLMWAITFAPDLIFQ